MTSSIEQELRTFATNLLERRGGLVEWTDSEDGTAIVPTELVDSLDNDSLDNGGEVLRLSTRPGGDGWCISLATDFLDSASRLLELEPRIGAFHVEELYLKRGKLDEAVRRAFSWLNARVRLLDTRAVRVEYHTWWFHALLVSEDRWETRFPVTINASSRAEVELPNSLDLWELKPHPAATQQPANTFQQAVLRAQHQIRELAGGFFDRMDGRLQRDRRRLQEYYNALLRENNHKKSRKQVQPDPEKQQARERAVKLELRRKATELDERYAMQLTLEPVVQTRMEIPVLAVDLSVQRKREQRNHTVYWNPLLKQLEPICCSGCGCGTFSVSFTNEEVDPLCPLCRVL